MDYQFEFEGGTGRPLAKVSLEHEGFGEFLTEELGRDEVRLVQLLRALRPAVQGQVPELTVTGAQWSLQIEGDEVRLEPHHLGQPLDAAASRLLDDEAIDRIDGAAPASCGIDDFYHLLQAWHSFIRR